MDTGTRKPPTIAMLWRAATFAAALLMAGPALAQTITPDMMPPINQTDGNGADASSGIYSRTDIDVSIGPAGAGGLSFGRIYSGTGWRPTTLGTITFIEGDPEADPDPIPDKYVVSIGATSETFDYDSGDYVSVKGSGATLSYTDNGAAGHSSEDTYTYTTADGTEFLFESEYGGAVEGIDSHAVMTKVTAPTGTVTDFHYTSETVSTTTLYRLQAVTNSYGYQLHFEYDEDSPANTDELEDDWTRLIKAVAINNAVDYCSPTADTCSGYSEDWPTAEYDYDTTHETDIEKVTTRASDGTMTRELQYVYSGGRLSAVKFPGSPGSPVNNITISYHNAPGQFYDDFVDTIFNNGRSTSYDYSQNVGAGTRTTTLNVSGASNHEYIVSDLDTGLVESFTNTAGDTTTYEYDDDNFGRLEKVTYPEGNYVEYTYDNRGNVVTVRNVAKSGSGLSDIVACNEYMEGKDLSSCGASPTYTGTEVDADDCSNAVTCNKLVKTINALGETTTYSYNSTHGGVTSIIAPDPDNGGALVSPETRFFYAQERATYRTGTGSTDFVHGAYTYVLIETAACASSEFDEAYNSDPEDEDNDCDSGDDKTRTLVAWPDDPGGTLTSANANNLQPASVTAQDGNATPTLSSQSSFTYDAFARVEFIDGPLAGSDDQVRNVYDGGFQLAGAIGPDPDDTGPLKHAATRYLYNARGQVISVEQGKTDGYTDANWTNATWQQKAAVAYDKYGRRIGAYAYDGATSTILSLSQTGYDSAGRIECVVQRMNPSQFSSTKTLLEDTTYQNEPAPCDSPTTTGDFGRDRVMKYVYDAADGRLEKTITAYDTALAQDSATSTFTENGLVETVTDANGNKTTYTYDGFDRLLKTCYPNGTLGSGVSSATDCVQNFYTSAGLLDKIRPRKGHIGSTAAHDITFTYDDLGRVTTKHVPGSADGTTAKENYDYTYDNFGRVKTGQHHSLKITYGYDALGRLTSRDHNIGSWTAEYEYDAAGRMTKLIYPESGNLTGRFEADYEYDLLGRPTAVKDGAASLASIAYDDLGRRDDVTFGNGTVQSYGFDGAGRLSSLTNDLNGSSDDQTYGFTYNPASQIAERTSSNTDFDWAIPSSFTDDYVANGLNQYTDVGGVTSVDYDNNGNITTDHRGQTYVYDAENRLRRAKDSGGGTLRNYVYSAEGMVRFRSGGVSKRYFHGGGGQELMEFDGTSQDLNRLYVRIPGSIDEAFLTIDFTRDAGCTIASYDDCAVYAHTDARGSVVATSDDSGDIIDTYTYSPYGEPGEAGGHPFRFTGQKYDDATGLYYYKARFYDPETGRFLQTDPIGYGDGLNMYQYVGGDPVNMRDPWGLAGCEDVDGDCVVSKQGSSTGFSDTWWWGDPWGGLTSVSNTLGGFVGGGSFGAGDVDTSASEDAAKQAIDESLCGDGGTAVSSFKAAAELISPNASETQISRLSTALYRAYASSRQVVGARIFRRNDVASLVSARRFRAGYYTSDPSDNLPRGYAPGGASDPHNSRLPGNAVAVVVVPNVIDYNPPGMNLSYSDPRVIEGHHQFFQQNWARWQEAQQRLGVPFVVASRVDDTLCVLGN